MSDQYEVLSPWAEADPVGLRGISPRVPDLAGRTIGLLVHNYKPAGAPILVVVEEKLKERFPTLKFSRFLTDRMWGLSDDKALRAGFREWVKRVDTVIAAVGD